MKGPRAPRPLGGRAPPPDIRKPGDRHHSAEQSRAIIFERSFSFEMGAKAIPSEELVSPHTDDKRSHYFDRATTSVTAIPTIALENDLIPTMTFTAARRGGVVEGLPTINLQTSLLSSSVSSMTRKPVLSFCSPPETVVHDVETSLEAAIPRISLNEDVQSSGDKSSIHSQSQRSAIMFGSPESRYTPGPTPEPEPIEQLISPNRQDSLDGLFADHSDDPLAEILNSNEKEPPKLSWNINFTTRRDNDTAARGRSTTRSRSPQPYDTSRETETLQATQSQEMPLQTKRDKYFTVPTSRSQHCIPVLSWEHSTPVPSREHSTSVPPREHSISVPPREQSTPVLPREHSTSVPPREHSVSVPSWERSIPVSPREHSTPASPREHSTPVPSREQQSVRPAPPPKQVPQRATTFTNENQGPVRRVPANVCFVCHHILGNENHLADQRIAQTEYGAVHMACFRCAHCGMGLELSQFYENDGHLYCHLDFHQLFSPKCELCKNAIESKGIFAQGKHWHTDHFFCTNCSKFLKEHEPYFILNTDQVVCEKCHHQKNLIKCWKCGQAKPEVIEALGRQWCDKCFACEECSAMLTAEFILREDGTLVCQECEVKRIKGDTWRGII